MANPVGGFSLFCLIFPSHDLQLQFLWLSLLLFNPHISSRRCPPARPAAQECELKKFEGQSDDRSRVTHRDLAGTPQPEPLSRYFTLPAIRQRRKKLFVP